MRLCKNCRFFKVYGRLAEGEPKSNNEVGECMLKPPTPVFINYGDPRDSRMNYERPQVRENDFCGSHAIPAE